MCAYLFDSFANRPVETVVDKVKDRVLETNVARQHLDEKAL